MSSLHSRMKRKADKSFSGYLYTQDGASYPRIKDEDKKQRQRFTRRWVKRETQQEARRFHTERGQTDV